MSAPKVMNFFARSAAPRGDDISPKYQHYGSKAEAIDAGMQFFAQKVSGPWTPLSDRRSKYMENSNAVGNGGRGKRRRGDTAPVATARANLHEKLVCLRKQQDDLATLIQQVRKDINALDTDPDEHIDINEWVAPPRARFSAVDVFKFGLAQFQIG